MAEIKIKCKGADLLPLESLTGLQGNLKKVTPANLEKLIRSIENEGFIAPIFIWKDGETNRILDGHGRLKALSAMLARGVSVPPLPVDYVEAENFNDARRKLLKITSQYGEFELDELENWMEDLGGDLADEIRLAGDQILLNLGGGEKKSSTGDNILKTDVPKVTKEGDLWELGSHRLLCGDSTSIRDAALLMEDDEATLIHADPPYGMGKESDGVLNDNLYREKLDAFQMDWIRTFRNHTRDNGSMYIWGNPEELWRLWYLHLEKSERLTMRNQIVWDKKNIPGMKSPLMTQYPITTEHCLFIQIGDQFLGNVNTEDYPEQWDIVRVYLEEQAKELGINNKDLKTICGVDSMYSHWFTKSQYTLIPRKHYEALAEAYPANFQEPWANLKAKWDSVKGGARTVINSKLEGMRSYFDNSHDIMRDVWEFSRVVGEERFGHATPKPVEMVERAIKSSCPEGGIVAVPFGGSGPEIIACEKTKRIARIMELSPHFCDVIVYRFKTWMEENGREVEIRLNGEAWNGK